MNLPVRVVSATLPGRALVFSCLLAALGAGLNLSAAEVFEGFGAVTNGAASSPDGFTVYRVTSLANSGAGTLRDAVSQPKRHIVFDVAGTITLTSDLNIYASYLTLDGATAPAPGITINQPNGINTTIYARSAGVHDIVVQHLRVDGMANGAHLNVGDVFGMDGQDGPVYNVVIDHVTGRAATDGVFDVWGRVYNVTISWNLITDTIAALHFSNADFVRDNISIHHNVFARNTERQVRIKYDSKLDFVNNVVWGWGWIGGGGRGMDIDTTWSVDPTVNMVGNYYHAANGSANDAVIYSGGTGTAAVYMSGNILPTGETDRTGTTSTPMPVPVSARVTTFPASSLGSSVVPCVGTKYRTTAEQALLNQISADIGGAGGVCAASSQLPPAPRNLRIVGE